MTRFPVRPDLILAFVCLGLYIATAAQLRTGAQTALGVSLVAISQPFVRLANTTVALAKDAASGRQDWQATLAELQKLRGELERCQRENQILTSELAALRQGDRLLATFPSFRDRSLLARVTARDILGTHTLMLDRGKAHGLARDCSVLAPDGVLGRIDRVWETTSRVQLLSHPAAAAAAQVVGVEGEALLLGGERPRLEGFAPYTKVPPGSPVVTTGSEGIYPAGLILGVTGESRLGALFTVVPVSLSAHPENALVVLVLCRESP